jgi:hypothetical protein
MPPINQQGSRAGLVSALVTFVILFVVAAVFAFNNYGQYKTEHLNFETYKKQYAGYLNDATINSPPVQALVNAKAEQPPHFGVVNSPAETAVDVAVKQTAGLSALISGASTDQPAGALADSVAAELKKDQATLKGAGVSLDLSGGGLIGAVDRLTQAMATAQGQVASLTQQKAASDKEVQAGKDELVKVNAANADAAKAQQQAAAEAQAQFQKSGEDTAAAVKQMQADADAAKKANLDAQQASANQVADSTHQLQAAQKELEALRERLGRRRPDVTNAAIRVADGELIRVPGNGVCYINLGYGSGVTNGLTFEVYDKISGIPPIPPNVTGDEQLPVGKASIEIIHVGDNSSECRIVNTEPGAVLTEGDPIENLVYDAHQKYQFCVYGNFDLASTGRPNAADAEVVKRLITQWGGKLTDKIGPDTDFLVIGAEPVLPEFSKDDLTPENQDKLQKAQDALDKYQEIRGEAKDLHIPILNQNRFLYYVGYYDQATR